MLNQSCAIDSVYLSFLSLQSRSHWNPLQCGKYMGIEHVQIAAIFWHKGSYLVRRKLLCHCARKSF